MITTMTKDEFSSAHKGERVPRFFIEDCSGDYIDYCDSMEEGISVLRKWEEEDRADGSYEDFKYFLVEVTD